MFTSNTVEIYGDRAYDRVFQLAADIQDWPTLLPHYRYMRVLERSRTHKIADFGASRDGFPCSWQARQELFPNEGRITYKHIGGITKGMWVEWRLERQADHVRVTIDHELSYPFPVLGPLFAQYIVGNLFIHNIAGKTLECIKRKVESEQAKMTIAANEGPRRVVVTGLGAVTPIGSTAGGLWQGVQCARSAVGPLTAFDASHLNCRIGAQVHDFDPALYLEGKALRRLDRCSQFAVAAAKQAVADGKLDLEREAGERIGVCIGSALGGAAYAEQQHALYLSDGPRAISSSLALQMFVGAGSCNTAILLGLSGYTSSNADSCASGTIAIGNAWYAIQRGDADVMLAGGAEAPLAPLCFGAFALIRAMSQRNDDPQHACRPFDGQRDGFIMGEGSAVLLLEERERALARGAHIYAELIGFGCTNDAHHMTAPRPDGASAARSVQRALETAHVAPEEIDYINAHGSSTPLNDASETLALKRALGEETVRRIPISATKAMHGHALGASGAMEAAICCLAIEHAWVPPTVNYETPDPACDLDYVPNVGRALPLNVVLSNSFGFGGINASLVFRRPTP